MDQQARPMHRSATRTDDRPDARPAQLHGQPSDEQSATAAPRDDWPTRRCEVTPTRGLVVEDYDGDTLRTKHNTDGTVLVRAIASDTDDDVMVRLNLSDVRALRDHLDAHLAEHEPKDEPLAAWERELLGDTSPRGLLRAALNAAGIDALANTADADLVDRMLETWQGRALVGLGEPWTDTDDKDTDDGETVNECNTPPQPCPTVLEEAQTAVYGDRQADYGHPREDFTRTAILWTGLLHHKLADGEHLEPEDVARCMIAVKLARDVHAPKRDNRVDMAGYALTLDRLETGR